jgi:hypothetical protein
MKPRSKRLLLLGGAVSLLVGAVALVLTAFQENLVFFHTPSEVAAGKAPQGRTFRVGGMVEAGSIQRQADGLTVSFVITDMVKTVPVTCSRKARAQSCRAPSARTACSAPPKCWPSTTRTTCRSRRSTHSTRRR